MFRSMIMARARARLLVPVALSYGLVATMMFGWPGLVPRVADRCGGLSPLDVRGRWTAPDARDLVRACGVTGRTAYVNLQLLDLAYPAFSCAALLLATGLLLRRYGGRGWGLLLPALAMTVFDYAENASVWTLLLQWPHVNPAVAAAGGTITTLKRITGFAAFTIPILLGLVDAVHRGRSWYLRRRGHPAGADTGGLSVADR